MRSHDALACLVTDSIISHGLANWIMWACGSHVIRWGHMWITCGSHVIRWGHMWITWSGGVTCGSRDQVGSHVNHMWQVGSRGSRDQVGSHVDHMWSGGAHVDHMWLFGVTLVSCPACTCLPARNGSGEQSRVSWAHYPKQVMTNEIARLVIIT